MDVREKLEISSSYAFQRSKEDRCNRHLEDNTSQPRYSKEEDLENTWRTIEVEGTDVFLDHWEVLIFG